MNVYHIYESEIGYVQTLRCNIRVYLKFDFYKLLCTISTCNKFEQIKIKISYLLLCIRIIDLDSNMGGITLIF